MPRSSNRRAAPAPRATSLLALAGLSLAGAALFNALMARRAERRHPPRGSFIEVDGVRIHYVERGDGPPLVLLHGNAALTGDFLASGLVERLAATHRVIVFDRPGFGYTARPAARHWTPEAQAALLAEAARRLGAARPVVVGHSWGTLVATAWALDRPAQVARLVVLSGYHLPVFRLDVALQQPLALPGVTEAFAATVAPLQARLTGWLGNRLIFAPAAPTDGYLEGFPFELALRPAHLRSALLETAAMRAAAARLAPRHHELAALPVTIVHGDGDKLVGPQQARDFAARLPHATLVMIPGAGHMIHHSAPGAVAAAILADELGFDEPQQLAFDRREDAGQIVTASEHRAALAEQRVEPLPVA